MPIKIMYQGQIVATLQLPKEVILLRLYKEAAYDFSTFAGSVNATGMTMFLNNAELKAQLDSKTTLGTVKRFLNDKSNQNEFIIKTHCFEPDSVSRELYLKFSGDVIDVTEYSKKNHAAIETILGDLTKPLIAAEIENDEKDYNNNFSPALFNAHRPRLDSEQEKLFVLNLFESHVEFRNLIAHLRVLVHAIGKDQDASKLINIYLDDEFFASLRIDLEREYQVTLSKHFNLKLVKAVRRLVSSNGFSGPAITNNYAGIFEILAQKISPDHALNCIDHEKEFLKKTMFKIEKAIEKFHSGSNEPHGKKRKKDEPKEYKFMTPERTQKLDDFFRQLKIHIITKFPKPQLSFAKQFIKIAQKAIFIGFPYFLYNYGIMGSTSAWTLWAAFTSCVLFKDQLYGKVRFQINADEMENLQRNYEGILRFGNIKIEKDQEENWHLELGIEREEKQPESKNALSKIDEEAFEAKGEVKDAVVSAVQPAAAAAAATVKALTTVFAKPKKEEKKEEISVSSSVIDFSIELGYQAVYKPGAVDNKIFKVESTFHNSFYVMLDPELEKEIGPTMEEKAQELLQDGRIARKEGEPGLKALKQYVQVDKKYYMAWELKFKDKDYKGKRLLGAIGATIQTPDGLKCLIVLNTLCNNPKSNSVLQRGFKKIENRLELRSAAAAAM